MGESGTNDAEGRSEEHLDSLSLEEKREWLANSFKRRLTTKDQKSLQEFEIDKKQKWLQNEFKKNGSPKGKADSIPPVCDSVPKPHKWIKSELAQKKITEHQIGLHYQKKTKAAAALEFQKILSIKRPAVDQRSEDAGSSIPSTSSSRQQDEVATKYDDFGTVLVGARPTPVFFAGDVNELSFEEAEPNFESTVDALASVEAKLKSLADQVESMDSNRKGDLLPTEDDIGFPLGATGETSIKKVDDPALRSKGIHSNQFKETGNSANSEMDCTTADTNLVLISRQTVEKDTSPDAGAEMLVEAQPNTDAAVMVSKLAKQLQSLADHVGSIHCVESGGSQSFETDVESHATEEEKVDSMIDDGQKTGATVMEVLDKKSFAKYVTETAVLSSEGTQIEHNTFTPEATEFVEFRDLGCAPAAKHEDICSTKDETELEAGVQKEEDVDTTINELLSLEEKLKSLTEVVGKNAVVAHITDAHVLHAFPSDEAGENLDFDAISDGERTNFTEELEVENSCHSSGDPPGAEDGTLRQKTENITDAITDDSHGWQGENQREIPYVDGKPHLESYINKSDEPLSTNAESSSESTAESDSQGGPFPENLRSLEVEHVSRNCQQGQREHCDFVDNPDMAGVPVDDLDATEAIGVLPAMVALEGKTKGESLDGAEDKNPVSVESVDYDILDHTGSLSMMSEADTLVYVTDMKVDNEFYPKNEAEADCTTIGGDSKLVQMQTDACEKRHIDLVPSPYAISEDSKSLVANTAVQFPDAAHDDKAPLTLQMTKVTAEKAETEIQHSIDSIEEKRPHQSPVKEPSGFVFRVKIEEASISEGSQSPSKFNLNQAKTHKTSDDKESESGNDGSPAFTVAERAADSKTNDEQHNKSSLKGGGSNKKESCQPTTTESIVPGLDNVTKSEQEPINNAFSEESGDAWMQMQRQTTASIIDGFNAELHSVTDPELEEDLEDSRLIMRQSTRSIIDGFKAACSSEDADESVLSNIDEPPQQQDPSIDKKLIDTSVGVHCLDSCCIM